MQNDVCPQFYKVFIKFDINHAPRYSCKRMDKSGNCDIYDKGAGDRFAPQSTVGSDGLLHPACGES